MQQPHALRQRPVHPRPARPEPACARAGPAAHPRAEQPGGPDHRLGGRLPPRACRPEAERRLRAPRGLFDAGAPAPPGKRAARAVCGARCPAPIQHPREGRRPRQARPGFWHTQAAVLVDVCHVLRGPERRAVRLALVIAFIDQAMASTAVVNYAPEARAAPGRARAACGRQSFFLLVCLCTAGGGLCAAAMRSVTAPGLRAVLARGADADAGGLAQQRRDAVDVCHCWRQGVRPARPDQADAGRAARRLAAVSHACA